MLWHYCRLSLLLSNIILERASPNPLWIIRTRVRIIVVISDDAFSMLVLARDVAEVLVLLTATLHVATPATRGRVAWAI